MSSATNGDHSWKYKTVSLSYFILHCLILLLHFICRERKKKESEANDSKSLSEGPSDSDSENMILEGPDVAHDEVE